MRRAFNLFALLVVLSPLSVLHAVEPLRFAPLNQRSPQLMASYWNPILDYIGRKAGVALTLSIGKAAPDTTAMTVRGEVDLAFTNHLFTPERDKLGWRVIARPAGAAIWGEIVVLPDSPAQKLADLEGRDVVFPSREAFVAYQVTMDGLTKQGVQVTPRFSGNQEGAMGQLRAGAVAAASVNGRVMADYAKREGVAYRTLWRSDSFHDLAVMAHPRVPAAQLEALRRAFVGMADDPEGARILEQVAALVKQSPPFGFVASDNKDYDSYRRFFLKTQTR